MAKRTVSDLTPLRSKLTPAFKKPDVKGTPEESQSKPSRVSGQTSKQFQSVLQMLLKENFFYEAGSSVERSEVELILIQECTEKGLLHGVCEQVIKSRSLTFAVSVLYQYKVLAKYGKYLNLARRSSGTSNPETPAQSPMAVPLPQTPQRNLPSVPSASTAQRFLTFEAKKHDMLQRKALVDQQDELCEEVCQSYEKSVKAFTSHVQYDLSTAKPLSPAQEYHLNQELERVTAHFNFCIKIKHTVDYSASDFFNAMTLNNLSDHITKEDFPLLKSLVDVFIATNQPRQEEGTHKQRMLRMIHLYGCFLHIRSQKSLSEVPLLLAILLLSHGCGQECGS